MEHLHGYRNNLAVMFKAKTMLCCLIALGHVVQTGLCSALGKVAHCAHNAQTIGHK